jgi:hypothetical protein
VIPTGYAQFFDGSIQGQTAKETLEVKKGYSSHTKLNINFLQVRIPTNGHAQRLPVITREVVVLSIRLNLQLCESGIIPLDHAELLVKVLLMFPCVIVGKILVVLVLIVPVLTPIAIVTVNYIY